MKKKIATLLALVLSLCMVIGLAGCGKKADNTGKDTTGSKTEGKTEGGSTSSSLDGTYNITVWVSESDGVADLTKKQIAKFCEENPGIVINATVEGITEAESASQMITSVEDGADLYCFAQDQLVRLVQAGALNKLGDGATATVKERNDATSILAATVGDKLYCYPLTSDNGYFMYYDKSVIPAEHLDSLEDLIADCEKAGKMFSYEMETSAWYNAGFFFATGCVSEWETNAEGKFVGLKDTFNSDAGVIALKGMQKLVKSTCYNSSSAGADFAAAVPSAIVISGTWASSAVKEALGENYAATDLPKFTVDGKTYQLGSYSGCKLMGVKPQTDAVKNAVLQQLALYLTNAQCQLERFNLVGWGPSNLEAQKDNAVQSDIALAALALQNANAIPQGQIDGAWWDLAKVLGTAAKEATTDAELKAALETYEKGCMGRLSLSEDAATAFTVIGAFDGTNWDKDYPMTQQPEGTFYSSAINFKAGDEFKVRQGGGWDVNFGANGAAGGDNLKVEADGLYYVHMEFNKADTTCSVLELTKYSPIEGFTVIGTVNGSNWDKDFQMEIQADGTFVSTEAFAMTAGTEFKCRQGLSWDVNYGNGGDNFKVEADGTYKVQLDVNAGQITLIAQ
ncbi:MAG: extracellular solute-binding protein [Lachnospiraceae bacterium]|nr:extracellular solute-binding protein [Lachnospiraceae bacterium]